MRLYSGMTIRLQNLFFVSFITALFLSICIPQALFAESELKLKLPGKVYKGDMFKATVENAPPDAVVIWDWEEKNRLAIIDRSDTSVIFQAIYEGDVRITAFAGTWKQQGNVLISKPTGRKKPVVIEPFDGPVEPEKVVRAEQLFERFRSGYFADPLDFFRAMGDTGLSMHDMFAMKKEIINRERLRLIRENIAAEDALSLSEDFWTREFAPYERDLMDARQRGVEQVWANALREYRKKYPNRCFADIIRMDVGGLGTARDKLKFEGDIDLAVLIFDNNRILLEDAVAFKGIFALEIHKFFRLYMKDIDAFATAHRAATGDVFIGEYGARWAEKGSLDSSSMKKVAEDGTLQPMSREEVAITIAKLQNIDYRNRTGSDLIDAVSDEVSKPRTDMEPGISLEFLRHINKDAIRTPMSHFEKILKIAKYAARSAAVAGGENIPDPKFADAVRAIDTYRKDPNPDVRVDYVYNMFEYVLGKDWAADLDDSIRRFGERAKQLITRLAERGLKTRLDEIEKLADEEQKDTEKKRLLDDLMREYEEYEKGNMLEDFPKVMLEQIKSLTEHFKGKTTIPADELKKMQEFMEKAADNANMMKIAVATAWRWAETLAHGTDKAIDFFNEYLDILDNRTLQKLRGGDILEFRALGDKVVLKAPPAISAINQRLNESILGTIGNTTLFKGFNFASELNAYKDAILSGATWQDSFMNLSVEYFRRHIPGGTAVEAYMYGDYMRTGVELVYVIFPPLAIPEGLYGMALTTAEWGVGKVNEWKYEEMVDTLYRGASFEKVGVGKGWRMAGLSYDCPPKIELAIDSETKSQEGLYDLLNKCDKISVLLYPQVKIHPVLMQYEEMLDKKEVSSGKAQIMKIGTGWPYKYLDLSKYGKELYKTYLKKVDAVTLEYFKGVIQGLEKRKGWDEGTGYSKIIEIERELGCIKPLVDYSTGMFGDVKKDAKYFQEIVDIYRRLKEYNKTISGMKEDWRADFLVELKPYCTVNSIKVTEKKAGELTGKLTQAVIESREYVEKVIGREYKDEDLLPLTKARLCMAYFSYMKGNSSDEYARCYEDYQQTKADVDRKANTVEAEILLARPEACVGEKVTLKVGYNKSCGDCTVKEWEIRDEDGNVEERLPEGTETSWKPMTPGRKTIRAKVKIDFVKGIVQFERNPEKKIIVQPEDKCPKLKVEIDTGGVNRIAKDTLLTLTVKTVSLGPGSPPIHHYLWYEDKKQIKSTKPDEPTYQFSGTKKGGETVTVGVVAVDAHNNQSEMASADIEVTNTTSDTLSVYIVPEKGRDLLINSDGSLSINDEGSVALNAVVTPKKDSGNLMFRWSADKTTVFGTEGKTAVFEGKGWSGRKVRIDVVVMDKKNREGTAFLIVDVKAAKGLKVVLEDHPEKVTERESLRLKVREPGKGSGNYRYSWLRDGMTVVDKMTFDYFDISDFQGLAGKSVKYTVEVSDDKGRTGRAEAVIKVTEPGTEDKIQVSVSPDNARISEDSSINISCTATVFADSGRLTFNNVSQKPGVNSVTIKFSGKGHENLVPVVCEARDEKGRTGEAVAQIFVTKKKTDSGKPEDKPGDKTTTVDPKKLAEEKYQWIKGIPEYLEALIELDKKTHSSTEKEIRKTVLKKAAAGQYPQCDTACQKRAEELKQSVGDCGPYVVKEKKEDPLTGERILINVIKEDRPCTGADIDKSEEAARLLDPMSFEEFKCYEQITKPFKDHQQELKKQLNEVNESKVLKNYQDYTAWSMFKEYIKDAEDLKTRFKLPDPVPSPPVLPWTYSSSCGSAGGITSDQTKFSVTLKTGKLNLKREESANVAAEVKGGKSPFAYEWKGNYSGKGENVTFMSMKPGDHTLSVEVTDAAGSKGQASITLKVGGVTGTITGLANKVIFGTWQQKVAVQAKTEDGKAITFAPAGKSKGAKKGTQYRVIWQSEPAIGFYPGTSEDGKTDIFFDQMGPGNKIKIWADIQQLVSGGVYETIGDATQVEVSVVPPKFKWSFEPEKGKGRVGQEVKATITTDPKIKDELITYEWSYPESSNRMEYETNAGVIGFVPKDANPFKLVVAPKSKAGGEPVDGGLMEEYQIAPYSVTITEPHYAASKPRLWKCDTQLGGGQQCGTVEVSDQFAVHHNIYVEALISPELPKSDLRYKWTVIPDGSCGIPGAGDQLTINCSDTGIYNITVEIKDAKGIVLGKASRSINITISEKTLKESQKKIEEAEKAKNSLAKAFELLHQGKTDEAIELAEDVADSDPKSPALQQFAQEVKKLGWDAVYERDFEAGLKLIKAAVKFAPEDKDAKEKLDKTKKFQKAWPQVEKKAKEFDNLLAGKKVFSAYKKLLEIQDLQQEMPGTMANRFSRNLRDNWDTAIKEYNEFINESLKKHTEHFNSMDWDAMLAHAQEVLKREHSPAEQKNWEGNLDFAKKKISERNQAWQYYQSVKSIFEKGDQNQAYGMLSELKLQPQYFMETDPKRQQILDLIATLEKWHKIRSAKGYAMNLFFAGDQLLKDYHYGKAAEAFAEGLRAIRDNGDINDPVYAKYYNLYQDCIAKDKRLKELLPGVRSAATDEKPLPLETIQNALRDAEEMVSLQPNNIDWQIFQGQLEQKLKNAQKIKENKELADALWTEGDELYREGKYVEALNKLRESLKIWSNSEREKYVRDMEKALSKNKETAKKLRAEGEKFQNQKKIKEAIGKYRESLKYWPDPALEEHIRKIEETVTVDATNKAKADSLWKEGTDLFNQQKPSKALDKFRESITYWSNTERANYVKELEVRKAQALRLRDEGESLQNMKRYADAIAKYRESLRYWPDPALEEHIAKIEATMKESPVDKPSDSIETPSDDIKTSFNLSGTWTAKCKGGDTYTARITHTGSTFEAEVDTERYRGTITGRNINGKSLDNTDTINGEIISNNELRVTLTGYVGNSPITNNCTLVRGSSNNSTRQDNSTGNTLSVKVKNVSAQNVHIYPQGGKCSPDNKLTPGQNRTLAVPIPSDGFLKFCAGRNGKDLECRKHGIDPGYSGYTYTVIFDESNKFKRLLIYTGLK